MKGRTGTSMGGKMIVIKGYPTGDQHAAAEDRMLRKISHFLKENGVDINLAFVEIDDSHDNQIRTTGWLQGFTVRQILEAFARTKKLEIIYKIRTI